MVTVYVNLISSVSVPVKKKVENLSLNVDENDEVLYKVKVKCFVLGTKVKIGKKDASFTL